jgi:hypothetical protein
VEIEMTNKNIQEAEVGSGTKIADTKKSEKRAQISLKLVQLRMKQEKERQALAAQKKSLQKEETMTESFSASQIAALKAEYSKINTIDPDSDTYKKLIAMLDKLDLKSLKSLADANVKFVSKLAQNRVLRKSMKKEDVQLDEISTKLLAKAAHAASDPDADYHYGKSHDPQKFADRAKKTKDAKSAAAVQGAADAKGHYTRPGHTLGSYDKLAHRSPARVTSAGKANKQDVNKLKKSISLKVEEVESIDEQHSVLYKMKKTDPKIAVAHYKSKDDADKFLASVKEKGGNGVVRVGKIGLDLTSTDKKINELSTDKLADYKKKAGDSASAADKAGDTKTGNKRFSGIMKATRKQFDNDAKQKTEELSPKQKAMDKNKNGKIDGSDLAKLRGEELSPKQKALDKNKNGKIDGSDLAKLRKESQDLEEGGEQYKVKSIGYDPKRGDYFIHPTTGERVYKSGVSKGDHVNPKTGEVKKKVAESLDEGKSDYEVYHKDYSTAVQTAIKQAEKRGFEVDMDDWHDKVATGPKKPSAGKTNSFSVNLIKDGKESKKKLHLQVYNMDNHKYELNMYIEEIQLDELNKDTLHSYAKKSEKDQDDQFNTIGKGIRDNNPKSANKAGHKFSMRSIGQTRAYKRLAKEAASPAQQAAIAIAMKKAGKKPKDMEESDAYDKDVKPSDKPHDKEAAAKRAKLAALAARKKMTEGLMDKIKAIKRGMQAKDKADDHFDKAGDPKNANASKDLKKAVRYHNLLNKEEVVLEAKKKSWKDMRKKTKNEEAPSKATVQKGDQLTGKREPIEINPELKDTAK